MRFSTPNCSRRGNGGDRDSRWWWCGGVGERGGGGRRWGGESSRVLLYPTLHWHRKYGFCIKMDIDENHCNVSLINTRQCPQTTICKEKGEQERRIELKPSTCQLNAAPPGQTALQSPRGLNLFKGPIKAVFSYKIAPTRFKTTYRSVLTFEEKKQSITHLFKKKIRAVITL